jgi:glycerol-3-phosphate cytidylyltransferase-like family protein
MTEDQKAEMLERLKRADEAFLARWEYRKANPLKDYPIEFDVLGPVKKSKRHMYKRLQQKNG